MTKVWVAGKWIVFPGGWELHGVFDSEEKAIAACHSRIHFIGPVELNLELPDITVDWPGLYYPMSRNEAEHDSAQ